MASAKPGVQERILLHLLDYSDYKNSVEVPFSLSQMGIANAVAIARSNVPRAIAGLKVTLETELPIKGISNITNVELLNHNQIHEIIELTKLKQSENNNIYKNDRIKYLNIFFINEKKSSGLELFFKGLDIFMIYKD